jgi:PKD repeat protein
MKQLFKSTLLVFGLSGFLTACPDTPKPPEVVIPTTTKVITGATQAALETVQANTLTFSGSQPILAGDVLASAPTSAAPDGFLRKVTAVRNENGKTILETQQAALNEAIQEGSFDITQQLTNADIQAVHLAPGVRLAAPGVGLTPRASNPTFDFHKVLYDQDGNLDTKQDQVVLSGLLDLKTEFNVGAAIHLFKPNHFIAKATFTETSNLALKGKLAWTVNEKFTVGTLKFPHIRFSIGPIPVDIQPVITLEVGVKGNVNGEVDVSVTQSFVATAGVEYVGEWRNLSDLSSNFSIDSSKLSVTANAKAYADLKFALIFYGVVEAFIRPEVFAQLDAQFPRKPFLKIDGGFGVDAGVNVKLLDIAYSTNIFQTTSPLFQSGNTPPSLDIFDPPSTAQLNRSVNLTASANDLEDGLNLATKWTSNLAGDGTFETGQSISKAFNSVGVRTITVTTTDSDGASASKSIVIDVVNSAPTLNVSEPSDTSVIYKDLTYSFQANATDPNEPNDQLACSSIHWTSSLASDNFSQNGCVITASFSSTGTRTLTITGTDPQGLNQAKTVVINVLPTPANLPPRKVSIVSPTASFKLGLDGSVTLTANPAIEDPEGGAVTLEWFVAKQNLDPSGNPTEAFGTNIKLVPDALGKVNVLSALGLETGGCLNSFHVNIRITLIASDPQGNPQPNSVILHDIICVP